MRSRKEQSHEEISFGIGAYQTHSCCIFGQRIRRIARLIASASFRQVGSASRRRLVVVERVVYFAILKRSCVPKVGDRVRKQRFVDSLEDYWAGE